MAMRDRLSLEEFPLQIDVVRRKKTRQSVIVFNCKDIVRLIAGDVQYFEKYCLGRKSFPSVRSRKTETETVISCFIKLLHL